ncbi:hypothetical protein ACFU6S_14250 [Streptomyces sp. NPDC057456]|uniref:hypothetical protein n=1 Tax=Streptomyces sp. NPDC057456 TaxID=3346139 RepID=UPI0036AAB1A3
MTGILSYARGTPPASAKPRSKATERQLCGVPAEAPGEVCLRDNGRRAQGLEAEFTDPEQ